MTVAVIGSGLQSQVDLPAWRIASYKDFVSGSSSTPIDRCGHGTTIADLSLGHPVFQSVASA
ncbi:MAG: hypothetical protein ABI665_25475 [Vicinamibacterales bacterium]